MRLGYQTMEIRMATCMPYSEWFPQPYREKGLIPQVLVTKLTVMTRVGMTTSGDTSTTKFSFTVKLIDLIPSKFLTKRSRSNSALCLLAVKPPHSITFIRATGITNFFHGRRTLLLTPCSIRAHLLFPVSVQF